MTEPADRDLDLFEPRETDVFAGFEGDIPGEPGRIETWIRAYGPAGVAFVVVLVLWEGLTRAFDVETFLLPKPSEIAQRFVVNFDVIWAAGFRTFFEALGGFVVGGVMAVVMALATVRWSAVREGLLPFAIAANTTPIIALAPIANNWFNVTSPVSKMAVVAVIVFFPVMINTARGLLEVQPEELELLRAAAATPRQVLRLVRIPSALPFFFSSLKVASALSIIGAIVAEYFGGPQDVLGQYILNRANLFQFPDAWAAIVVASIIGITFYMVIVVAERLAMPWHVSLRKTDTA